MICEKIKYCLVEKNKSETFKDKKGGRSRYSIKNKIQKEYQFIDIENCVYYNNYTQKKCDFAVITSTDYIFIELKGSEVKEGLKQLLTSIENCENCFPKHMLKARLIATRFSAPKLVNKVKNTSI